MSELKTKRSLSGIYLRFQNPDTSKWENRVFEDCPQSKQADWINTLDDAAVLRLMEAMSKTYSFVLDANGLSNADADYQQGGSRKYYEARIMEFSSKIHIVAAINDMREESEIPENEREQFKKMD